jgi:Spy/CpxP family protein refolding chaperone
MSKRCLPAGAFAAALFAIAGAAGAQGGGDADAGAQGVGVGFAGGFEARWLQRHAKDLELDDKTLEAVRKIAEESRTAANKRAEELRAEGRRLGEALDQELPDPKAVAKQAEAMGRVWTEALKDRLNASLRMRELLTPEQRKKAAELRRKQAPGRRAGRP